MLLVEMGHTGMTSSGMLSEEHVTFKKGPKVFRKTESKSTHDLNIREEDLQQFSTCDCL